MARFAQTLEEHIYAQLEEEAKARGIDVRELLKAVIIPEWVMKHHGSNPNGSRDSKRPGPD